MLHHQLPEAGPGYDANAREALYRIYSFNFDPDCEPPEVQDERLWLEGKAVGTWARIPRPRALPAWLPQEEFEHMVQEYQRIGFERTLNWYRKLDIDWSITPQLQGRKVSQPLLFIAGTRDSVIHMNGGRAAVEKGINRVCERPPRCVFYRGCGHWVQLAEAERVNAELFAFLAEHRAAVPAPLPRSRL